MLVQEKRTIKDLMSETHASEHIKYFMREIGILSGKHKKLS
jgi:hypothetical protein